MEAIWKYSITVTGTSATDSPAGNLSTISSVITSTNGAATTHSSANASASGATESTNTGSRHTPGPCGFIFKLQGVPRIYLMFRGLITLRWLNEIRWNFYILWDNTSSFYDKNFREFHSVEN